MIPRTLIPVLLLVLVLSSCTTAYKTGQTPDDVYYSPGRVQDEYVRMDRQQDNRYNYYDDDFYDDRYLRMKIRNRSRWNELDDWYLNDRRFRFNVFSSPSLFWYDPWNPYTSWNMLYNPYWHPHVVLTPTRTVTYNKPRTFNLNTYVPQGHTGSVYNPKFTTGNNNYITPGRSSGSSRSNSGNILRDIFGGGSSSGSGKTISGSSGGSSGSGSSGSSGGGNAPVRRF